MANPSKMDNSEKETFQLVIEEYTQELANNTKAVNDQVSAFNGLSAKITELEAKIDKPKPVIVSADTGPIQEIVRKGITDMKITVGTKPQPVVKKYQILLFPEQDPKGSTGERTGKRLMDSGYLKSEQQKK